MRIQNANQRTPSTAARASARVVKSYAVAVKGLKIVQVEPHVARIYFRAQPHPILMRAF